MYCWARNGRLWFIPVCIWPRARASSPDGQMGSGMALKDRFVDPGSPDRRSRRAAYALPTLFTAGNIFLGYYSILSSFRGAMLAAAGGSSAPEHFAIAAKAIGASVFLDGLDGRIARMTNTTS